MNHARPLPVIQAVLLFLCIGAILLALANSSTSQVLFAGDVYAEIGPVYSRVHHDSEIITVYLNDYALPTNATNGKWGGPWFTSTDFKTYMILAVVTLSVAAVCTMIEVGVILHRMLHPTQSNLSSTPAVIMCGVSIMLLIIAAVGMHATTNLKIAGLKSVAAWGMAGAPIAIGIQVLVGLMLLCC